MDIRTTIIIIEASGLSRRSMLSEEAMDFSRSGKFWYNARTGETYAVRGHHTLVAFDVPELAHVLKSAIGESYEEFTTRTRLAAKAFFDGGMDDENDVYFELHDRVCQILCDSGFIRGINELVFYVSLSSKFERACRDLIKEVQPRIVNFDLMDLGRSGMLKDADLELFISGRSLKKFATLAGSAP